METKQLKIYNESFCKAFKLNENKLKNLKYNEIPEWDSIGHMSLISDLEDSFKISIETDDIVDFSSYEKGKQIIKKYI